MRLKHSRLSGSREPWSCPTLSLTWLIAAFLITCEASRYVLTRMQPSAPGEWLALSREGLANGFYWQFLTQGLVNSSIGELLASVGLFFVVGNELETLLGPRRLASALLLTLIPSAAFSLLWPPEGGEMGMWPGICGLVAVLCTMLPLLEFRYRLFGLVVSIRLRVVAVLSPTLLAFAVLLGWVSHTSLAVLPPALILGYFYARCIGYGMPTRIERYFYDQRLQRQRWERLDHRSFIEQEVDPVLEKIARAGRGSLSRRERKVLRHSVEQLNNP